MMNSILENDTSSPYENYNLSMQERIPFESDYVQQNIVAFKYIRKRDYIRASEAYKQCLILANKLGNNYKIKDSLCNYGVSLFYCGNFDEAVSNLESAFNKITNKEINNNDFLNIQLSTKIISNLIVLYLCLNNFNNALIMIDHLSNILKNFDNAPNLQLNLIKNINYIFFRVESLINIDNILNELPRDNHHQIIIRIIKAFHSYLKNNNIDIWINCLTEEIDNLKNIKDYNGIILALFNIQTSNYIKGKENMNNNLVMNSKYKFIELLKVLNNSNVNNSNLSNMNNTNNINNEYSDEDVEKCLSLIKEKMNLAVKIYNLLYTKENSIYNGNSNSGNNSFLLNNITNSPICASKYYRNSTNKTINNSYFNNTMISNRNNIKENDKGLNTVFFTKLLLRYALKYIKNTINNPSLEKQLCSHIQFTLKFLNNEELDISYLKLIDLSPEITKSLETLFKNLLYIYERNKLYHYFQKFKNINKILNRKKANNIINNMLEKSYIGIKTGEVLMKINYNSKDTKNHYYLLDPKKNCISVYNKSGGSRPESEISFRKIRKILYGIKTKNLTTKIKTLPYNDQPYLYMSLLLKDRSIDLAFSEQSIKKWFYGIYYHLMNVGQNYKIISCTNFVITKTKLKLHSSINNIEENNVDGSNNYRKKFQIKNNLIRDKNLSFTKSLLLYNKINPI